MHVTQKIQRGLPSLRHPAVQARIKQLAAACERRGVKVIASATMTDHIHLGCCPESREAMTNAMRYFFGELAKFLNRLWKRRGKVFVDRYFSRAARSARQCWHVINYIMQNPVKAGIYPPEGWACDPFLTAHVDHIGTHRFLCRIFGSGSLLRDLLVRFSCRRLRYESLGNRLQLPLFAPA